MMVEVMEGEASPGIVRPMAMMARMDVSGAGATPIEAGQQSVTAHVTVQFVSSGMTSTAVTAAP